MHRAHVLRRLAALSLAGGAAGACTDLGPARATAPATAPNVVPNADRSSTGDDADAALRGQLAAHGFTGRVASTLEARLGRRVDRQLADVGRLLWFDPIQGLNDDNACGGCH